MREELAAVGVSLSDDEYTSTIIRSLPAHYANYIAHLSASAHLLKKTLKPDDTMRYLTQEYDRLNAGNIERWWSAQGRSSPEGREKEICRITSVVWQATIY